MAIQFCNDCGDTLPISADPTLTCDCCGESNQNSLLSTTVTSTSRNFPSKLREKLTSTTQILSAEDKKLALPRTDRTCPECEKKELCFSQVQLRGADEGSTIFYFCLGCGYRFKEDN